MSDSNCEQQLQTGAYLLGALQPEEAERYREHLDRCASCRDELDRLQPAVGALARTAKPAQASDALLGRIMAQVRSEAELLNAAGAQADRVPAREPRWRTRRLTALAAATAVTAAAALGAILIASGSPNNERVTRAVVSASMPGGRAELRQGSGRAELVIADVPQPPSGKIYEVWLVGATGAPRTANALFSVNKDGSASVDVPGDLRHVRQLMVTAEPARGSRQPTSAPIITATLESS